MTNIFYRLKFLLTFFTEQTFLPTFFFYWPRNLVGKKWQNFVQVTNIFANFLFLLNKSFCQLFIFTDKVYHHQILFFFFQQFGRPNMVQWLMIWFRKFGSIVFDNLWTTLLWYNILFVYVFYFVHCKDKTIVLIYIPFFFSLKSLCI